MPITATAAVNTAVAEAKNLPDLVNGLSTIDPALATQITGKALLASKTPWGTLAAGIVGWVVAHYGLGWDANICALVGGGAVLVGSYAMRLVTSSPITSLVSKTITGGAA